MKTTNPIQKAAVLVKQHLPKAKVFVGEKEVTNRLNVRVQFGDRNEASTSVASNLSTGEMRRDLKSRYKSITLAILEPDGPEPLYLIGERPYVASAVQE